MHKKFKVIGVLLLLAMIVSAFCMDRFQVAAQNDQVAKVNRPPSWTDATHSKDAAGDYLVVFPDDRVQRIDIIISPSDYQTMESDLARLSMLSNVNPVYVPATVKFNNLTWYYVGVRYKGESTLYMPKMAGKHKYPFRLNFDKFEDRYPEIKNQRFYGFKKLILSNNWYDPSFIRDKVCSDIFRDGGVPAARGAFYRVYVDTGSGPVYWGLYTAFEDPSDVMLKTQFANADGNLYKAQATGADWTTFSQAGFEKKTNEGANDWSDLQAAIHALNASRSGAASWRAGLDAVFDAGKFLRWLAINTAIVNFDNYGWVTKNYYLYQDLANNGRLVFIPWDFNLSLTTNPFGGFGFGGFGGFGISIASLSLSEIGSQWPLIRFLMDDSVYNNLYKQEMRAAIDGCFNEAAVTAKMRTLHELVRPYVVGREGESGAYSYLSNGTTEFNQALTNLLAHVSSRQRAVRSFLGISPSASPTATNFVSPTPNQTASASVSPTSTPTRTATPSASATTGAYLVTYTVQNDWGAGATVNVTIKNNSASALSSWNLKWTFGGNQQITNQWNAVVTQNGTAVSASNASYNGMITADGGTVSFGFNLSYSSANANPTGFTLNGVTCAE
jgi:spore coat protein H